MTQFASLSVSDQAKIDGRDDHTIRFRPGEPGMIRVRSVPAIVRAHAKSGYLGILELTTQPRACGAI